MPVSLNEMLRGLRGRFNRRRKDGDYLFLLDPNPPFGYLGRAETGHDDRSSISSHSTNSTVDNNPGTGRIMDKCFYQPLARRLERVIFRMRLPSFPPARISAFFEETVRSKPGTYGTYMISLRGCMKKFWQDEHAQTYINGLKCLAKQTLSSSLYQSAAALTSLIHVSTLHLSAARVYVAIAQTMHIFHAETLVSSLDDSHPIKKYTILLISLAKAHTIAMHDVFPSNSPQDSLLLFLDTMPDIAIYDLEQPDKYPQELRQAFLRLLDTLPDTLIDANLPLQVAKACHIHAHALFCLSRLSARIGTDSTHIRETLYFTTIFLLQSIPVMYTQADSSDSSTHRFVQMVLSALSNWLDATFMRCVPTDLVDAGAGELNCGSSFRGLLQAIPVARALLPNSCRIVDTYLLISHKCLPRRIRAPAGDRTWACAEQKQNPPIIQALIQRSTSRTIRLFSSFAELKREVGDSVAMEPRTTLDLETHWTDVHSTPNFEAKRTFGKDLWYHMCMERLLESINFTVLALVMDDRNTKYRQQVHRRRKWAPFFLSNLDWDWDLAGSLEQLYALSTTNPSADTHRFDTHIVNIDNGDVQNTWHLTTTTITLSTELPKEVRIPYRTETGELRFRTYDCIPELPDAPMEERASVPDNDPKDEEPQATSEAVAIPNLHVGGGTTLEILSVLEELESEDNAATTLGMPSPYDQYPIDVCQSDGGNRVLSEVPFAVGTSAFIEALDCEDNDDATVPELSTESTERGQGRIQYTSEMDETMYITCARAPGFPAGSEGLLLFSGKVDDRERQESAGSTEADICAGGTVLSRTQCFIEEMDGVEGNVSTTALETSSDSGLSLEFQECGSVSSAQGISGLPVLPWAEGPLGREALIAELAVEARESTAFKMSAKSTQTPTSGNVPASSFVQHIGFATGAPENQAFIEELDGEKDGDATESRMLAKSTQMQYATVTHNGMGWFRIMGIVCASIMIERLILAILRYCFGRDGRFA